jgi:hypothetical protein
MGGLQKSGHGGRARYGQFEGLREMYVEYILWYCPGGKVSSIMKLLFCIHTTTWIFCSYTLGVFSFPYLPVQQKDHSRNARVNVPNFSRLSLRTSCLKRPHRATLMEDRFDKRSCSESGCVPADNTYDFCLLLTAAPFVREEQVSD